VRAPAGGGNAMSALRVQQGEEGRMLTHPAHDRLVALGLTGMAKALDEQRGQRNVEGLTFEERLGLLVDREVAERESKRLVTRLKYANLRQDAAIEDLDTRAARGSTEAGLRRKPAIGGKERPAQANKPQSDLLSAPASALRLCTLPALAAMSPPSLLSTANSFQ